MEKQKLQTWYRTYLHFQAWPLNEYVLLFFLLREVVVNLFVAIRADVAFAFLTDSRLAIPMFGKRIVAQFGSTFRYLATVP